MDHPYGGKRYVTQGVRDDVDGYAGVDLYCIDGGTRDRVARVVFWDAMGEFSVETFNGDLPVDIVEQLIAEARASIAR